jgi:hypothetical protein
MKWKLGLLLVLLFGLAVGIMITIRTNVSPPPQTKTKRASDFRANSEPAGFRGIPWMIDLSILSNMREIPSDLKGYRLYERIEEERIEKRMIGEACAEKICYYTLHNKFVKVEILFNGQQNWDLIKKIVFERFGPGRKSIELSKENYFWIGKQVSMGLMFDPKLNQGHMDITHDYILEVMMGLVKEIDKHQKEIEQIKKKMKEQGLPTDELEDF